MLSTGSNRFERWQGNSDIIAFAFLFDAIICRIKINFLVIMTSSDSVSISLSHVARQWDDSAAHFVRGRAHSVG